MSSLKALCSSILLSALVFGCTSAKKKQVDNLFFNATIYTVDSSFSKAEAMAINADTIVAIGTEQELKSTYKAKETKDLNGKTIIPGLFDAHAHFFEFGTSLRQVNLVGSESYDEMIERIEEFQKEEKHDFIIGHGWDQNKWPSDDFPTKEKLDSLFPDTPVVLHRIDLHAMLVNQKALDKAEIDESSSVEGGTFIKKNGALTGTLVDNAMDKIFSIIPNPDEADKTDALLRAQEESFSYGLTNVADAGLAHEDIQLMDKLASEGKLKINLYPMLMHTDKHLDDYLENGLGNNEYVSSHSIKIVGDGALGSRGAALRKPYSDDRENYGKMLLRPKTLNDLAEKVVDSDFQLNTHAIGDSTNHVALKAYHRVLEDEEDRRWRIEHASVVDTSDLKYFSENIIPSIQSTFAISDMPWLENRLGKERVKNAYTNKDLLDQAGLVALGTDAPVEEIDPYRTFYAAVARKNRKGEPEEGFQSDQALSREEALKGMTIWAAYSEFLEKETGSLEPGKKADFVVLDRDIMEVPIDSTINTKVKATFLNGKKVYSTKE